MEAQGSTEYMNREIDEKFENLLEHMREFEQTTSDSLGRIEEQTTKTNGRVTDLEAWKNYVIGFCACITILLIPLVYFVVEKAL